MEEPNDIHYRPEILKVLCILTFIGSGLSLLSYLLMSIGLDVLRNADLSGVGVLFQTDDDQNILEMFLSLPRSYFLIHSILYTGSLSGAVLMWNLRKTGFHIYAVSQILLLITYQSYMPDAPFPYFPLLITIVFILLYFSNLKFMR